MSNTTKIVIAVLAAGLVSSVVSLYIKKMMDEKGVDDKKVIKTKIDLSGYDIQNLSEDDDIIM